jgi:hypothetical protein
MNRLLRTVSRPASAVPHAPRPSTTAVFGRPPQLTVRVASEVTTRRIVRRPFAASRIGYDHSWIGALAFAATLLFAALAPARAADALDGWTKLTLAAGAPTSFNDLKFINGKYWVPSGAGKIYYSTNLVNWNLVQTPSDQILTGIDYANGMYVATGLRTTLLSSPDGITWTKRYEHPQSSQWPLRFHEPIFANGEFVAVGTNGLVYSSADGVSWNPEALIPANFDANGVEYAEGLYVAIGDGGAGQNVRTSPDLVTWTEQNPQTGNELEDVTYGNGVFVATGWNNTIVSSPDGITWTKHTITLQYQQRIWGVEFCNGLFVAYGQYGAVLTSPDGAQWTKRTTMLTGDIGAAAYDGANLIITGNTGGVQKSDPWAPWIRSTRSTRLTRSTRMPPHKSRISRRVRGSAPATPSSSPASS